MFWNELSLDLGLLGLWLGGVGGRCFEGGAVEEGGLGRHVHGRVGLHHVGGQQEGGTRHLSHACVEEARWWDGKAKEIIIMNGLVKTYAES